MAASSVNITHKTTAFIAVAQAFITACETQGIDDQFLAYKRVGEIIGYPLQSSVSPQSVPVLPVQTASNVKRALTGEEAKQAKAVARERKALKLGVKAGEVNLTPQEVEKARAEFRDLIAQGRQLPKPGTIVDSTGQTPLPQRPQEKKKEKKSVKPTTPPSTTPGTSTEGSPSMGGAEASWTRVCTARRNCKRDFPLEIQNPCALHLVAYTNEFHRLTYQWESYESKFPNEASTKADVFRGLVNTEGPDVPLTFKYLTLNVKNLRMMENQSFVTWVLQNEDSQSFFEKGRPSAACPKNLAEPIPKNVLEEIDEAFVQIRKKALQSSRLPQIISGDSV
jgi:hypothetical protein